MSQAPFQPNYMGPTPGQQKPAGMAVTAMVLGICSFVLCFIPYLVIASFVTALLAIILGAIAKSKAAKGEAGGGGMAVAGLVLGIVWYGLLIVAFLIGLIFGLQFVNFMKQQQQQNPQWRSMLDHSYAMLNMLSAMIR